MPDILRLTQLAGPCSVRELTCRVGRNAIDIGEESYLLVTLFDLAISRSANNIALSFKGENKRCQRFYLL